MASRDFSYDGAAPSAEASTSGFGDAADLVRVRDAGEFSVECSRCMLLIGQALSELWFKRDLNGELPPDWPSNFYTLLILVRYMIGTWQFRAVTPAAAIAASAATAASATTAAASVTTSAASVTPLAAFVCAMSPGRRLAEIRRAQVTKVADRVISKAVARHSFKKKKKSKSKTSSKRSAPLERSNFPASPLKAAKVKTAKKVLNSALLSRNASFLKKISKMPASASATSGDFELLRHEEEQEASARRFVIGANEEVDTKVLTLPLIVEAKPLMVEVDPLAIVKEDVFEFQVDCTGTDVTGPIFKVVEVGRPVGLLKVVTPVAEEVVDRLQDVKIIEEPLPDSAGALSPRGKRCAHLKDYQDWCNQTAADLRPDVRMPTLPARFIYFNRCETARLDRISPFNHRHVEALYLERGGGCRRGAKLGYKPFKPKKQASDDVARGRDLLERRAKSLIASNVPVPGSHEFVSGAAEGRFENMGLLMQEETLESDDAAIATEDWDVNEAENLLLADGLELDVEMSETDILRTLAYFDL